MIDVSVIIPVFNAEKYIKDCIESLLAQTLVTSEFIFINDGSTDNSKNIIESYQYREARIVLINQENKGVSAARNQGIEVAKGNFLSFVDADDYIARNFLEILHTTAQLNEVQIVTSNFNTELNGQLIQSKPLFATHKRYESAEIKKQIVPFFIKQDEMNTACNKLYSRKLFLEHNLRFPVGVVQGEDGLMNIQAFYYATAVYFIDYNGYYYREVMESATRNLEKKDYFKLALSQYSINYEHDYKLNLNDIDVEFLKSKRLITMVYSLIYLYLNPNNSLLPSFRKTYVKQMISNEMVQLIVHKYWDNFYKGSSKYYKFMLFCIAIKSVFGLKLAITYTNYRNNI